MSSCAGKQCGLSLLEVLVAISIMATIAVLAFSALEVTERSRTVSDERLKSIQQLDRVWLMLESDLRNGLASESRTSYGDMLPPFKIAYSEEYWLNMVRGGKANPLLQFRTELQRVAYRLEDDVLWRDSWYDPGNVDPDLARKQKLLEGVTSVEIRVLSPKATSVDDAAWKEEWPILGMERSLPIAARIELDVKGRGKIERLFLMTPGK